jgi:hypothetical protein
VYLIFFPFKQKHSPYLTKKNLRDILTKNVVEIIALNHRFSPNLGTPTLFKCLKSTVKKLRFFKRGDSRFKTSLPDLHKFAAWRRQICFRVEVLYSCCSSSIYYGVKFPAYFLSMCCSMPSSCVGATISRKQKISKILVFSPFLQLQLA